jgi:hypothetical protein
VKVARPSPDDPEADGEVLFSGKLAAGERKIVSRPGLIFIQGEPRENLDVEANGQRFNLGKVLANEVPRTNRGKLPP